MVYTWKIIKFWQTFNMRCVQICQNEVPIETLGWRNISHMWVDISNCPHLKQYNDHLHRKRVNDLVRLMHLPENILQQKSMSTDFQT